MADLQPIGSGLAEVMRAAAEARAALTLAGPPEVDAAAEMRQRVADRTRSLMSSGAPEDAAELVAHDDERRARIEADARRLHETRGIPLPEATVQAERSAGVRKLQPTHALQAGADFLARCADRDLRAKKVLVLAGPKDACKSTALTAIVSSWPQAHPSRGIRGAWWTLDEAPLFVPWTRIIGIWYHKPTEHEPVDPVTRVSRTRLMRAKLLALDDVGQEPADMASRCGEILDELLDMRPAAGLFTAIATNYEYAARRCAGCRRMPYFCDADERPQNAVCHARRRGEKTLTDTPTTIDGLINRYPEREGRIGERLTQHAGKDNWVTCPVEGFRNADRRKDVLQRRATAGGAR